MSFFPYSPVPARVEDQRSVLAEKLASFHFPNEKSMGSLSHFSSDLTVQIADAARDERRFARSTLMLDG
jgi:hypothetical protein